MKYTDYLKEIGSDAEYRDAKEALKVHFALGDAVLRARLSRNWTQEELAEQVGTKQANISRIEAGLGNPTLKLIQKIIQVLDLEVYFATTPSSTFSKTISDEKTAIPVDNWPVSVSSHGTKSHSQTWLVGERK
jgi:ribosome-binding protein aMBF1 (putative translation factor)